MTVQAVRSSLLRNTADEGPSKEEEWEGMVRRFILHVESLPPGTVQEELSLMFAAALDPTLVRMRAANALLVNLAQASASPDPGIAEDDNDDDDEDEDDDSRGAEGGGGGSGGGSGTGGGSVSGVGNGVSSATAAAGGRKKRFRVRLDLDAVDGEGPPPGLVQGLLKAVKAAAAAVEAVARAEGCLAAAGDTLSSLLKLGVDYKRSLPPGPREPIQHIIAEEQARVFGYTKAHESIVSLRLVKLREVGAGVGDAYRAISTGPGWRSVSREVDALLSRFLAHIGSRLPNMRPDSNLLRLDFEAGSRPGAVEMSQ